MTPSEKEKCFEGVDVVVVLEGGLVQSVSSRIPGLACVILDYDADGADEEEIVRAQDTDGRDVEAMGHVEVAGEFGLFDEYPAELVRQINERSKS